MNEVSIIINGVRYDSIEEKEIRSCQGCELFKKNRICLLTKLCGLNGTIFKKSDKSLAMNARDFFDLVTEMRQNQKGYFKTRSTEALRKSKELEKQVDDEIARVIKIMKEKQMNLFEP